MKKATDKTIRRRKLVVRREVITELTQHQLQNVVGGWTTVGCQVSMEKMCADNPI